MHINIGQNILIKNNMQPTIIQEIVLWIGVFVILAGATYLWIKTIIWISKKFNKRNDHQVRMFANCGCEEEMHFTERWCKRCREE